VEGVLTGSGMSDLLGLEEPCESDRRGAVESRGRS
jgi:hypothetical protein